MIELTEGQWDEFMRILKTPIETPKLEKLFSTPEIWAD
jgi:uncharacterized protein (DUF1778 family)